MRPTQRKGLHTPSRDDYNIKSICPSGGHGRGHRPALQNRAAARNVPVTVNSNVREARDGLVGPDTYNQTKPTHVRLLVARAY